MDWPVYNRKVITKQQLVVTQNWHQQDASASSMRMRQFTPRQPPADLPVKPQEYKSDPEVSLNYDDLYARAWEYDYDQPIFDADRSNPPEIHVQSDFSTEEMKNTPGTANECSPEIFLYTDKVSDVTDTCPRSTSVFHEA